MRKIYIFDFSRLEIALQRVNAISQDNFSHAGIYPESALQFRQPLSKDKVTTNNSLLINSDGIVDIGH